MKNPTIPPARIREAAQALLPEVSQFLAELVRIPSLPGQEHQAMEWLHKRLTKTLRAEVDKVPLNDTLKDDPDYSNPVAGITYNGRYNLRVTLPGAGGPRARTVLLNSHVDVVPPSEGMTEPYSGRIENGILYGRGACDAKGQVATIYLVHRMLEKLSFAMRGTLVSHIVNEEENGGNGSLAMARQGEQAAACIVLEPSDGKLQTSIRGAVWFRLRLIGKAGHSGQAGQTRSALLLARDAMGILEKYHAELLARSRGLPLFDPYPNPMPITFGKLHAGNWPASAPSEAIIEGVLGLLPNVTKEQVCAEMRQALVAAGEPLASNFELTFMYRHDSSVVAPDHELPATLLEAADRVGSPLVVSGMTASCDAWFYNNQLGIPTVVCGPGSLKVAHSKDEQIELAQIATLAETLTHLILAYCEVEE